MGFAFVFELSLGLGAFLIGWLIGANPARTLVAHDAADLVRAVAWGALASIPLSAVMLMFDRWEADWLRPLKEVVRDVIVPWFQEAGVLELALLSFAAGLGEELLFRGLLQDGLAQWIGGGGGAIVALIASSLVFGVCHWVTHTYAVIAFGVSLYLGLWFWAFEDLIVPIAAHSIYDFLALMYLLRWRQREA